MTGPWRIAWNCGSAEIQALGGMLGPATFEVGGKAIQPFFVAPWASEEGSEALPGLLRALRGEWPCVPFGVERSEPLSGWEGQGIGIGDGEPHGYGANQYWHLIDSGTDWIEIGISYPPDHPIRGLRRRIAGRAGAAALDIDLWIEARMDIDLGLALHPTFRLPETPGALQIEVAGLSGGMSFPAALDATSQAAPGCLFNRLDDVPGRSGRSLDFSRQPFAEPNEDLLQVQATSGVVRLTNAEERWIAQVSFDPVLFPSVVLWVTNRGWRDFPWSGRIRALGVEPARSAFDLGQPVSSDPANPLSKSGVPTAIRVSAGEILGTRYSISLEALA